MTPGGKKPWRGQGIEHASTDPTKLHEWFDQWPDANVGIRLDGAGLLAVDIDPRNGGRSELEFELPKTLTAKTQSGGRHLVYRVPHGTRFPGKLERGVDLKHRGYIVVEPSVHATGGIYSWLDWDVLAGPAPFIAEAPPLHSTGQHDAERAAEPRSRQGDAYDHVREGGRNTFLSDRAFALRKNGASIDEILKILRELNKTECVPPLLDEEVVQIAKGKERVSPEPEWGEPQPLVARIESAPYPLQALPSLIRGAVEEVAAFVKAPISLVSVSALAAVSVAAQGHADVERASRLKGPSGLYLLAIADSGERKSTCDGFFTGAIREFEQQQAEAARPHISKYKADLDGWGARRDGLIMAIKNASRKGNSTGALEAQLRAVQEECPTEPRVPRMLLGDETPENLAWRLAKQWPAAGVISSEAGLVFGSYGMGKDSVMRNLSLLNILWDGSSHSVGRRTSESFVLKSARLTVALQVQAATLKDFFDRSGSLARGTGFLARFLIAWPESTQGRRPFTEAPDSWPQLDLFNKRITDLLLDPFWISEEGAIDPTMFALGSQAKDEWVKFHDRIEEALGPGRELYDIKDVASKAADNAARLAALFQVAGDNYLDRLTTTILAG